MTLLYCCPSPVHCRWPHSVILEKEGPNDGLVSVESAKWVSYLHPDGSCGCGAQRFPIRERISARFRTLITSISSGGSTLHGTNGPASAAVTSSSIRRRSTLPRQTISRARWMAYGPNPGQLRRTRGTCPLIEAMTTIKNHA